MSATETTGWALARQGIERISEELELEQLRVVTGDFDIFEAIDSFAVVELLMTTEALLEEVTGRYVPLANEKIFDAEHSPLRSFDSWAAYVEGQRQSA